MQKVIDTSAGDGCISETLIIQQSFALQRVLYLHAVKVLPSVEILRDLIEAHAIQTRAARNGKLMIVFFHVSSAKEKMHLTLVQRDGVFFDFCLFLAR